jgi:hypothetical protein
MFITRECSTFIQYIDLVCTANVVTVTVTHINGSISFGQAFENRYQIWTATAVISKANIDTYQRKMIITYRLYIILYPLIFPRPDTYTTVTVCEI